LGITLNIENWSEPVKYYESDVDIAFP